MLGVNLALLFLFSWLLIRACDFLISVVERLSRLSQIGKFAISSMILALATTLPELVVSLTSAFSGNSVVALGTTVGSNIANISLIIGGAAVMGGGFSVAGEWLKLDIMSVFLAGALPLILLLDNQLSRSDGLVLLSVFAVYNYGVLRLRSSGRATSSRLLQTMIAGPGHRQVDRLLAKLFLAVALLIFSADMLVRLATDIAGSLGISVFLISLLLVAVGTSLPELSLATESIRKRQAGIALGDLFGSVVTNSTMILGLVVLIRPIKLTNGWQEYALAAATFGVMFLLFWGLIRSKKKLERWEGLVLIAAYLVFVLLEFNK